MKSNIITVIIATLLFSACDNTTSPAAKTNEVNSEKQAATIEAVAKHYKGAVSNGMKGDSIFFDVSADGKKLSDLTFKGYWRCDGKLESTTAGPKGSYDIINGNAKGHLSDPPAGGSTAWRFDIDAVISGNTASGTFRMNINNLGCDTYLLKWTAIAE